MSQGRSLEGEPERLITQALKVDPNNVKALALADRCVPEETFHSAIAHGSASSRWRPPDPRWRTLVRQSIAEAAGLRARRRNALPKQAPRACGWQRSAARCGCRRARGEGSRPDGYGVHLRAAADRPAHAACRSAQAGPRPAGGFLVDDTMAMTPTAKLSSHEQSWSAQCFESGNPRPASDWRGLSAR